MSTPHTLPNGTIIMVDRYSQLSQADQQGVRTVLQVIESENDPDGTNGEWLLAKDSGPGWTTTDNGETYSRPIVTAPVDPCEWLLDLGPFADRFQPYTLAIDMSTDPVVMAFHKDLSRRKYINLKDPRVRAVVYYFAGATLPGVGTLATPFFDMTKAALILDTPVVEEENRALRKDYF